MVAKGVGHFLGEAETYARMHSDFLYPVLADRTAIDVWEAAGSRDIRDVAADQLDAIMEAHHPHYIDPGVDSLLRATLPIKLSIPGRD